MQLCSDIDIMLKFNNDTERIREEIQRRNY